MDNDFLWKKRGDKCSGTEFKIQQNTALVACVTEMKQ